MVNIHPGIKNGLRQPFTITWLGRTFFLTHDEGRGAMKSLSEAMVWYRQAADRGYSFAMRALGWGYERGGTGVSRDYALAMKWYRAAAEKGLASAEADIGRMYANGTGVEKDAKKALEWYAKAAEKGNAYACNSAGWMYEQGEGVTKDAKKAVEWYRKGADKGSLGSMGNLGRCYANGIGVERDAKQAIEWWNKAIEKGDYYSLSSLGYLYYDGWGIAVDRAKALDYFEKALEKDPHEYTAMRIWLSLGSLGRRQEGDRRIRIYLAEKQPKGWARSILEFMVGDKSGEELLKLAVSLDDDELTDEQRLCEAHFYVGSKKLFGGDREGARKHFAACVATKVDDYTEYRSSEAELKR